jgi:Cof subfamily protein (haloacid dehalogenase superfamily)
MKTVKMIALDLDGTLISEDQRISLKDRAAIRRAQASGIPVVIATGRLYPSTRMWLSSLDIHSPSVCCNGADIREGPKTVYSSTIDAKPLADAYRSMDAFGVKSYVYCENHIFCTPDDYDEILFGKWGKKEVAAGLVVYCDGIDEIIERIGGSAIKFVVRIPDKSRQAEIKKTTASLDYFDVVMGEALHYEFTRKGTNKAEGLFKIANKMGIGMENVLAIGDSMNDFEMLRAAGTGIAMGNAMDGVKRIADEVTRPIWESGVAYAISRCVFGGEEAGEPVFDVK